MKETVCKRCGRTVYHGEGEYGNPAAGAYAYVVHDFYGCDSGCCGHVVYLCDADEHVIDSHFEFTHPYEGDMNEFCRDFVESVWPGVECRLDLCEPSDD